MKDNISNSKIGNRKVTFELRFKVKPIVLDKLGTLAESIVDLELFPNLFWGIQREELTFFDNKDEDDATNKLSISPNKINYTCFKMDSIERTYSTFEKIYKECINIIGKIKLHLISCTIIGSYMVNSADYEDILESIKKSFPSNLFFDKYQVKDLGVKVQHETGMYQIAPIKKDEVFFENEFCNKTLVRHNGILIGVENHLTDEVKSLDGLCVIKDIYQLSLAIEKDIYEKVEKY